MTKQQPWTLKRVEELISGQIEESQTLEYKGAAAIGSQNDKKSEITKDVTAFAHAAGGILIYGITEDKQNKHLPSALEPITDAKYTKEWLENVITTNTDPPLRDFKITPVRVPGTIPGVIYVIEIPQSNIAHQAADFRYYKRMNFQATPMYGYEIRDIQNRKTAPKMQLKLSTVEHHRKEKIIHKIAVSVTNMGGIFAKYLKVYLMVPEEMVDKKGLYISTTTSIGQKSYYKFEYQNMRQDMLGHNSDHFGAQQWSSMQYHPILPGMEVPLGELPFKGTSFVKKKDEAIIATIHVDNEQPRKVKFVLKGSDFLEVKE